MNWSQRSHSSPINTAAGSVTGRHPKSNSRLPASLRPLLLAFLGLMVLAALIWFGRAAKENEPLEPSYQRPNAAEGSSTKEPGTADPASDPSPTHRTTSSRDEAVGPALPNEKDVAITKERHEGRTEATQWEASKIGVPKRGGLPDDVRPSVGNDVDVEAGRTKANTNPSTKKKPTAPSPSIKRKLARQLVEECRSTNSAGFTKRKVVVRVDTKGKPKINYTGSRYPPLDKCLRTGARKLPQDNYTLKFSIGGP